MSTDRDTTRVVRSWLRTEMHASPDRVLDAVIDALDTTPQHRARAWPMRRIPPMNTIMKVGLAAAAVGVAAVIGFNYLVAPNLGSPGTIDPTPTPVPSPTPMPVENGALAPGRYVFDDVITADIILTVPEGWQKNQAPDVIWTSSSEASLGFSTGDDFVPEACDGTAQSAVGPTVDDLVAALESAPGFEVSGPTPVTVDGYSAMQLDLTSTCPETLDHHNLYWVLDVDGERLLIGTNDRPGATDSQVSELQMMVDSLQIEP